MTDHAAALQSRHADRRLPEAAMTDHAAALPLARRRGRARLVALAVVSAALVTAVALALVPVACLTLFRTRRLYARVATLAARAVLRLWGVRLVVHRDGPFPIEQTVYVSNHSSTIDLFALVALGLPNTRFFLTGALRRVAPLGFIAQLMGTFFTAPQSRPAARVRIFQRADRTLRRTGESVYLSPEGARITTGGIGHFNKGAFHLATSLRAPHRSALLRNPAADRPGPRLRRPAGRRARPCQEDDRHERLAARRAAVEHARRPPGVHPMAPRAPGCGSRARGSSDGGRRRCRRFMAGVWRVM